MYTYAFLADPVDSIELPEGITGSLQLVKVKQLAALVEPDLAFEVLQETDQQLVQAVLSHDRVIREMFEQTAVLPLRFGTQFVSHQALIEHLEVHETAYLEKLDRLQGKAEYLLKLIPLLPAEIPLSPDLKGRDYFLAKKQSFQRQFEWQQQQQQTIEALIAAIAHDYPDLEQGEPDGEAKRLYLLVDRSKETELLELLQKWQNQPFAWRVSLGEALPPYHFV
jgi:hypothetical protein